jgi:RTX calcium-binding nonapeptide repeat (4 copies)
VTKVLLLVGLSAALALTAGLAVARPAAPGPAAAAQDTPDPTETPTPEPPIEDPPVVEDPPIEQEPPVRPPPRTPRGENLCPPVKAGEHCGPGNGRRTGGGGDKVSHKGWPAVTGVFFMVQRRGGRHSFTGTALNDEILGYDGHDHLVGGKGKDILWGDWRPVPYNPSSQRDRLSGGPGKDFIYTSHGRNIVRAGKGNDRIYAHWGRGVIDCGPGKDWVGVNNFDFHYTLRNCERRVQW